MAAPVKHALKKSIKPPQHPETVATTRKAAE